MKKRKAFYWTDAAEWIALNDSADETTPEEIVGNVNVKMISDLTGIPQLTIAQRIIDIRNIQEDLSKAKVQSF